jgi:hypothetical protein
VSHNFRTKSVVGIGRILPQKIVRVRKIVELMKHEAHGASFRTLKMNEVSNSMLTNVYTRKSDAFFRFVVVGRADCLPTPVNLRRWFGDRGEENCQRYGRERKPTLAHILNECTPNYPLMTKRHNRLASVVRRAIERFLAKDLRSEIQKNEQIEDPSLPGEMRRMRPDIVFERSRRSIGRRSGR